MTVSSTDVLAQATGTGATATYNYSDKKLYSGGNLVVKTRVIATGVVTTQVKDGAGTYDYTVSVESDFSGGTVTLNNNLPATHEITIERILPLTQLITFPEEDAFPTEVVERAYDRLIMIAQQLQSELDRCIKFSSDANDIGTVEFNTTVANRANKFFSFDANGDLSVISDVGTNKGAWAASTAYVVTDIVRDTSNYNLYRCVTAHTSSGVLPISSNADSAKWSLLVDLDSVLSAVTYYALGGSAGAFTFSGDPTKTAYNAGDAYYVKANHTPASTATLNIDSLGAKNIYKLNGTGTAVALGSGDMENNGVYLVIYDGTQFILVNPTPLIANDTALTGTTTVEQIKGLNSQDLWQKPEEDPAFGTASTYTVTDNAVNQAIHAVGRPARIKNSGATYEYGVIKSYSTGTVTWSGPALAAGHDWTTFEFAPMEKAVELHLTVQGTFADAADGDLQDNDGNSPFHWLGGQAYLVYFQAEVKTDDTGANQPRVNIDTPTGPVSTSNLNEGVEVSETGSSAETTTDISATNYGFTRGNALKTTVDGNGSNGDAEHLTVRAIVVCL